MPPLIGQPKFASALVNLASAVADLGCQARCNHACIPVKSVPVLCSACHIVTLLCKVWPIMPSLTGYFKSAPEAGCIAIYVLPAISCQTQSCVHSYQANACALYACLPA